MTFPAKNSPVVSPSHVVARDLGLILLLALLIRLVTYNGAFGSDDLTYYGRAAQLARGEWTSADYNGALRYGFNLPAAGFMALFGRSLFAANLWPLCCSLVEIGAVYAFANSAINHRAGVFSALLLASAPLHIAVATRIHADPVVSMFLTLGFVLLYFGATRRNAWLLFTAGISIGGIFWSKELAAVTWFAFLPMLWFFRGKWQQSLYVVYGVVLMMALHGLLMYFLAGDPLHLIKVVLGAVKRNFVDAGQGEDGAAYYLKYLFLDLRHVGMLALVATASVLLTQRKIRAGARSGEGFGFALIWWIGLLTILSVFPISLHPLRFPMKQSNYITLFLAPLALLAGMGLATLPRIVGRVFLAICVATGLLLGALQQADYRVFTSNSRALAKFASAHPRSLIVGSTNNSGLGSLLARIESPELSNTPIISFKDVGESEISLRRSLPDADALFAVIDHQTIAWFAGKWQVAKPLPCWQFELILKPTGLGFGNTVAMAVGTMFAGIKPVGEAMNRLAQPQSAEVYRVNGGDLFCRA